jgi:hypothetical protein
VLPHQFGQDLILALDLLLQALDPFLFGPVVGPRLGLEGRRPHDFGALDPVKEIGQTCGLNVILRRTATSNRSMVTAAK